jgi:hypothetical protein
MWGWVQAGTRRRPPYIYPGAFRIHSDARAEPDRAASAGVRNTPRAYSDLPSPCRNKHQAPGRPDVAADWHQQTGRWQVRKP